METRKNPFGKYKPSDGACPSFLCIIKGQDYKMPNGISKALAARGKESLGNIGKDRTTIAELCEEHGMDYVVTRALCAHYGLATHKDRKTTDKEIIKLYNKTAGKLTEPMTIAMAARALSSSAHTLEEAIKYKILKVSIKLKGASIVELEDARLAVATYHAMSKQRKVDEREARKKRAIDNRKKGLKKGKGKFTLEPI